MKDQNAIHEKESKSEKWARAHSLFLESLYKADHELRGCSHNQKCYHELMEIREEVIKIVKGMQYKLKPGEKNTNTVKSFNGISVTLLGGALGKHYMKDWTEDQVAEYTEWVSINS
tara:strand:+ start:206 stop:553 length:348 start_codon:yes stop_codon:yes gene_type:complete